jgi:uncharacterized protein (UPF0548 family)
MFYFSFPNSSQIQAFIKAQSLFQFNYSAIGQSRTSDLVPGFDNDFNHIELGHGPAVFEAAKTAICQWKMFPSGWTKIEPEQAPIVEGGVVAMLARVMGVWWINSCRIVYVIDNDRQFGFAYGTLPRHVERGEELFLVELDESGVVHYRIRAFSKPRLWLVRLAYPVARQNQKRFCRESKAAVLAFVQSVKA